MIWAVGKHVLRKTGAALCACAVVLLLTFALTLHSPRAAAAPARSDATRELDEVVVRGLRVRLANMRQELVQLEDRFYAEYNELNTVRDFDIHCVKEARTGTRMIRRTCRAVYEDKAIAQEGEDALHIRQYLVGQRPSPKGIQDPGLLQPYQPPAPPLFAILARLPDFQKNMKALVSKHPELLDILRDRAQLTQQYEALRRRAFSPDPDSGNEEPVKPKLQPEVQKTPEDDARH